MGLFAISLFLTPFTLFGENPDPWPIGLWCILFGWTILATGAGISWLANPLVILTWIMFSKNIKAAAWLSLFALIFSSSFLFADEIIANEAGTYRKIAHIGIGYYFWFISNFISFLSSVLLIRLQRKQPFIDPHQLDS